MALRRKEGGTGRGKQGRQRGEGGRLTRTGGERYSQASLRSKYYSHSPPPPFLTPSMGTTLATAYREENTGMHYNLHTFTIVVHTHDMINILALLTHEGGTVSLAAQVCFIVTVHCYVNFRTKGGIYSLPLPVFHTITRLHVKAVHHLREPVQTDDHDASLSVCVL